MGYSRQEFWSGLPFPSPGDLPDPGTEPTSFASPTDSLPLSHQGNPWVIHIQWGLTSGCVLKFALLRPSDIPEMWSLTTLWDRWENDAQRGELTCPRLYVPGEPKLWLQPRALEQLSHHHSALMLQKPKAHQRAGFSRFREVCRWPSKPGPIWEAMFRPLVSEGTVWDHPPFECNFLLKRVISLPGWEAPSSERARLWGCYIQNARMPDLCFFKR